MSAGLERHAPPLDGLRGVAVLFLLAAHTLHKLGDVPRWLSAVLNGDLGVSAFFVLSGYLITSILLREYQSRHTISLRQFYLRRALRIFPAFYAMLAVMVVLAAVIDTIKISGEQALLSGVYLVNYSPVPIGWWLGHVWTLSNEEQFYVLWPTTLLLLRPRWALRVALTVVAAAPLVRVASYVMFPDTRDRIPLFLHTRVDNLLIGAAIALVAMLYPAAHERMVGVVARYRLAVVAIGALAVSSIGEVYIGGGYMLPVGYSLNALAVVVIILAARRPGVTRSVLSWRPFGSIGVISYGLYLWQQVFLSSEWKSGLMASAPFCLILIFGVAVVSRFLIELPALRLKDRFAPSVPLPATTANRLRENPSLAQ